MTLTGSRAGVATRLVEGDEAAGRGRTPSVGAPDLSRTSALLLLLAAMAAAAALRLINLGAVGLNSDEVVYAGQSAALAENSHYVDMFPVFRAHPMLIQSLLSLVYGEGERDIAGRVVVALIGVATVGMVYLLGAELFNRRTGVLAAALIAVIPYHVIVTRQILLDGPMVFFATLTLLCLARFGRTQRVVWMIAAGGAMGLAMLSKESSVVLLGGVYAFLALSPGVRRPILGSLGALAVVIAVFLVHPVTQALAGSSSAGKSYLIWQLLRRPNHDWAFYAATVPWAIGPLVLLAAVLGLRRAARGDGTAWREVLLCSWIAAPVVMFELWPVKGYQYLLPVVPAVTVLAARGLLSLPSRPRVPSWLPLPPLLRGPSGSRGGEGPDAPPSRRYRAVPGRLIGRLPAGGALRVVAVGVVVLSALAVSAPEAASTNRTQFLAGTGGVPGGRETGRWIGENTPAGAVVLTLGPSMANIVMYYGDRRSYGLSVSPNPLHRNPSYTPIVNPDRQMRQGDLQYVVWDAYSAARSPYFSEYLLNLTRRYHGRIVHSESVDGRDDVGREVQVPVAVVYEVRP